MKKYIYYAHHLYKYGTKVEEYELDLIRKQLPQFEILNPNGDIIHADLTDEGKIMEKCLSEISRNDVEVLVFSSLNGVVGKGVFDEVNHALSLGKPVYYICSNTVERYYDSNFTVINESRRVYAIVNK